MQLPDSPDPLSPVPPAARVEDKMAIVTKRECIEHVGADKAVLLITPDGDEVNVKIADSRKLHPANRRFLGMTRVLNTRR